MIIWLNGTPPVNPTFSILFAPSISIAMDNMLDQLINGEVELYNAYPRAVKTNGNVLAKESMSRVFRIVDANWRGGWND